MPDETLLFIGGPLDALPAIGKAYALGYGVMVVDFNVDSPGIRWAKKYNQPYFLTSTYDIDGILRATSFYPIDGVLAVACDVALVVSKVAATLGVPYIPSDITKLSWDKAELKRWLPIGLVAGPPLPTSGLIVIKPPDSRGGRGITIIDPHYDNNSKELLNLAFAKAKKASPTGRVMIEEYIPGNQISAESIVWHGQAVFTGLIDRDYSTSLIIERGGWGPSKYDNDPRVRQVCQQVITCLGLENGTIKFDLVVNNDRVVVLEAAIGRLSGGFSCTHYLPISYGVDFLKAAFQLALGHDPDVSQVKEPLHCRGWYANDKATCHNERGKFRLRIAKTREELCF